MDKRIIIYTSNSCAVCKGAKSWFDENGYEYEERNIDTHPTHAQFLIENGYRGVPVIVIDDIKLLGFNRDKIKEILKK